MKEEGLKRGEYYIFTSPTSSGVSKYASSIMRRMIRTIKIRDILSKIKSYQF